MPAYVHILAENEGIGAVIFFVIWAIIAVVSQIQKWQEAQRKKRQMNLPPPPAPVAQPPTAARAPERRMQPKAKRPAPVPRQMVPKAPPPLPPKPLPVRTPAEPAQRDVYETTAQTSELSRRMAQTVGTEQSDAAARAASERPAITAQELTRAMRPRMLLRSFVLTELLAPPVALRGLQADPDSEAHQRVAPQRPA